LKYVDSCYPELKIRSGAAGSGIEADYSEAEADGFEAVVDYFDIGTDGTGNGHDGTQLASIRHLNPSN
jgi:hypothetical protein